MFCCMNFDPKKEENPLIVDLQEVLHDKAWTSFIHSCGSLKRRFLKRRDFTIEVPENYFVFSKEQQRIEHRTVFRTPQGNADDSPAAVINGANPVDEKVQKEGKELLGGRGITRHDVSSPEHVSLDTEFLNETAQGQTYNFKFAKQRKSTINVSFQRGFTMGGKANFSLGIPVVGGQLGMETTMQYQVTKTEGETFEETMTMEATSNIAVGPNSCYTANIQLDEKNITADFRVTMRMCMPQERAPIYIKQKRDGQLVFVYVVKNLPDTFDRVSCAKAVNGRIDVLDFEVDGVVKGSLACNHKIQLSSDESDELKRHAQNKHYQD